MLLTVFFRGVQWKNTQASDSDNGNVKSMYNKRSTEDK